MSLWDTASTSAPTVRPPARKAEVRRQQGGYARMDSDQGLAESLLGAEQELVSPQEAALLAKISNVRLVSEEDLLREEARDRADAMARLNTDVHKIHEVFSDLAGLVSQQAEAVDSIERDVEAAHDRTGKGVGQIEKAVSHQKGGFKCVIIALSIVAGVLAVVALAAVVYTRYASPI